MTEKTDAKKIEAVVRSVIHKYGYENVILSSKLSLPDAGRILAARRKVIQEVMRITSLDYGEAYTRLEKVLRHYKTAKKVWQDHES